MVKKNFTLIIGLLLCGLDVFSSDTTMIRTHDHVDMTWYGNYDKIGVFPDGSETYRKIYLHYTMGCPSSGCAPYDYTTKIEVLHNTGEIDSTLQQTPAFTVNGVGVDTLIISDTSYIYYWDTLTSMLDSTISIPIEVVYFDTIQPTMPIDTLYYFPGGFYNMIFDSIGNIIDSIYVNPTGLLINSINNWYSYFDVIEKYEIARVITPYGGNIPSNYAFKHIFDITDFESILQDSVKIRAHYSGWGNGWSATLDFEFIKGIPPRNVNSIENIYSGSYSYVNSSDFENNKLNSQNFLIQPNTTQAMIKMTATGHGFDNNINAAEFKPIDYFVNVNGLLAHTQFNWNDDCGENPIYPYYENPNGGYIHTWILDRANWCPGLRAKTFDHEITDYIIPSDSIEIDIDFQGYSWSGTQTPSYIVESQLLQYQGSNFNNSAEITDIIKPSSKDEYSRFNPTCGKPLIEIRNYGSTTLNTLEIEYGIIGGSLHTYNWSGSLEFLETEEVELPLLTNWHGTKDVFYVKLNNPNGQADDYDVNNYMETVFEHVPQYQDKFAVWTTINNGVINSWTNESETSWVFFKDDGSLHAASQQMFLGIVPQNQYRDTIDFESGCYTFKVTDLGENGLDYGYNNDGVGSIKLRNVPGTTFKDFHPDFGSNIIHNFRVGSILSNEKIIHDFIIYPIPAKDEIVISGDLIKFNVLTIVDNSGRFVKELSSLSGSQLKVDISNLSRGVYFITSHDKSIIRKFVKQ
ncbi:MAG: hypothetical protein CMD22_07465 [Flavobacteriales bacterium]|nr:hypothetical protein [Flavobacteriales bacterium]|tara:strand:- start:4169 stop:6403 length:2235 start_codon:yes stop_codon:yes gene_type:complete